LDLSFVSADKCSHTINKERFLVSVREVGRYKKSIFGSGCLCEPIQIIVPNLKPTTREAKKIFQSRPVLIPTQARPYPHAGTARPYPLSLSLSPFVSISLHLSHRSTWARFLEAGMKHEVGVALDSVAEGWVTVDGRKVVQLRRL
jgi:hypothetical protein